MAKIENRRDQTCPVTPESAPLDHVPDGWTTEGWISRLSDMVERCRPVRPDMADYWTLRLDACKIRLKKENAP